MLAALSAMSVPVADRYALQFFRNTELVGVYTFFAAISVAVQSLVHANVGMVLYPRTVQAFLQGNHAVYRQQIRRLAWQAPAMAAFFGLGVAVVIYPLLAVVERPLYAEYLPVLWIGLVGVIFAAAAEAPHAALYVRHHDIRILGGEIATAFIGLVSLYLLVPPFGVYGAALGVSISWLAMYFIRGGLLLSIRAAPKVPPGAQPEQ
jgi:O-antigen/teichoic acid export membrane protein